MINLLKSASLFFIYQLAISSTDSTSTCGNHLASTVWLLSWSVLNLWQEEQVWRKLLRNEVAFYFNFFSTPLAIHSNSIWADQICTFWTSTHRFRHWRKNQIPPPPPHRIVNHRIERRYPIFIPTATKTLRSTYAPDDKWSIFAFQLRIASETSKLQRLP